MKNTLLRVNNGVLPAPTASIMPTKFWSIAEGDNEAEITMYGEIVDHHPIDWWTGKPEAGMYITPEGFLEDLATVRNKARITVRINSVGGDLYTGMSIYTQLKELPGTKTVIIDGIAASAASVIAMAGDVIRIPAGGTIMIHDPSVNLMDSYDAKALKGVLKTLDAAGRAAAEVYAERTGLEVDAIRAMMSKTEWMVGQEAIDKGFATELLEGIDGPRMVMSADRSTLIVNGMRFDTRGLTNIPKTIPIQAIPPEAAPRAGFNKCQEGGNKTMSLEELRKQHPELVAQIETEAAATAAAKAVADERIRLKAIEEIAPSVGDVTLVTEAKYGEQPMSAEQLAFSAMKRQAQLGSQHLRDHAADVKASGAEQVAATPNAGPADNAETEISNAVAMIIGDRATKKEEK